MADGFSYSVVTRPLNDALAARVKLMDRGTMWALRQMGRVCSRAAKAEAPVYRGGMTQKSYKADRSAAGINAPVSGLLRASIKPSRQITHAGGVFWMTVGPRGPRTNLYKGKIEALHPYMAVGAAAAEVAAPGIFDEAVARVMR